MTREEVNEVLDSANRTLDKYHRTNAMFIRILTLLIILWAIGSLAHAAEPCDTKKDHYRVMKATTNGNEVWYQMEVCFKEDNNKIATWNSVCFNPQYAYICGRNYGSACECRLPNPDVIIKVINQMEYKEKEEKRQEYLNSVKKWERIKRKILDEGNRLIVISLPPHVKITINDPDGLLN